MQAAPLSIIIPVLNDAGALAATLSHLQPCLRAGHEIIVVDGGSTDASVRTAMSGHARVLMSGRGRALQMNTGAECARHEHLLFLHADSRLPDEGPAGIQAALAGTHAAWGRFDVALSGDRFMYRVIANCMNWRSRVTGIATGDQGIFVTKSVFFAVGAYPEIPLMEDIALSKALRKHSRPTCLSQKIQTSSRRWDQNGIARTILLMWRLRLAYFLGASPWKLAARYGHARD